MSALGGGDHNSSDAPSAPSASGNPPRPTGHRIPTNDSFATMDNTPVFATTRPFDANNSAEVERFLTEGNGVGNWSLVSTSAGNETQGGSSIRAQATSELPGSLMPSVPRHRDPEPSPLGIPPQHTLATFSSAPSAAASPLSPSLHAQQTQVMPEVSTSVGSLRQQLPPSASAVTRAPARSIAVSSSEAQGKQVLVPVLMAHERGSNATATASSRPTSLPQQQLVAGATLSPPRGKERSPITATASSGIPQGSPYSHVDSNLSYGSGNDSWQQQQQQQHSVSPVTMGGNRALAFPSLAHRRSEGDLYNLLFSTADGGTGRGAQGGAGPGRPTYIPRTYTTATATAGAAAPMGSVTSGSASSNFGSRRRPPTIRATENACVSASPAGTRVSGSSGSGGGGGGAGRPQWLSAAERVKLDSEATSRGRYAPTLPVDQSKFGSWQRQDPQQGTLTAQQLRAHEAMGGFQPGAGSTGTQSTSPMRAVGAGGGARFALTAHDEAVQYAPSRQHQQYQQSTSPFSGRYPSFPKTSSEQSRRMHVRAGGRASNTNSPVGTPTLPFGSSGGRRGSPQRIITASETHSAPPATVVAGDRKTSGTPPTITATASSSGWTSAGNRFTSLFTKSPFGGGPFGQAKQNSSPTTITATASGGGGANGGVLYAKEEYGVVPVSGSVQNGGGTSVGATTPVPRRIARDAAEANRNSAEVKAKLVDPRTEEDREEHSFNARNINALHAIPWEQRHTMPMTGFGTRFFAIFSSPRFWEKLDWTVRGSLLTVLPTMVLSLEPATAPHFPMPSLLAFYAFWITMPTFGSGLREFFIALKGFTMGLVVLCIVIGIQPGPAWLSILLLFIATLCCSFIAEETKKTTAYVVASTIMNYVTDPKGTNFNYVGDYYICLLISLCFAIAGFLIPFIRWSSDSARHYISALGNALSISVQGMCGSFWVRTPLERELNIVRLRQLRATAAKCIEKIDVSMDESEYESHTGKYLAVMQSRYKFCISIYNILGSLTQLIELIAENPELTDTPMCNAFGSQIHDDLEVLSSAMDSMILKIVDFRRLVTTQDVLFFREARERFQDALTRVREDVILTNENYETDESDIFLGFFMFSVDELSEVIANYAEIAKPRNNLIFAMLFIVRDIKSVIAAFRSLFLTIITHRTIPRRMKESIKLALCMTIPTIFQVYALSNEATSPLAGAAIIALVYNPTGSESFHYASGRLLGTVLGSTASLLCVQIASGRRWVLYIFIILLSFIGAYVQAAPGFYALGNAIVCSTISITTQYQDQNAAMVRIQQNCFAILIYFAIVSVLWPMQARTKVKMGLDVSLRCVRETTSRLLRNLDMPEDASEVTADVAALLKEADKKINSQACFIPGAVEEPTLGSVEYPEEAWKKIVGAERKLHSTLSMMRYAYHVFMSSTDGVGAELSVHWVVLHRIAPHAKDLSDLVYALVDLYLLSLSKATVVPASHLTRLRLGMIEARKAIFETYIQTIQRKITGDEEDGHYGEDGSYGDDGDYGESYPSLPLATSSVQLLGTTKQQGDGGHSATAAPPPLPQQQFGSREQQGGQEEKAKKEEPSTDHNNNNAAVTDDTARQRKKQMGYLTYDLTTEEEAQLRNYLTGRLANSTFAGTITPSKLAGSPPAGPTGGNDDRLMALAGTDDTLAARLRKKHRVMTAKEMEAKKKENGISDTPDGNAVDVDNLLENNSFIKNTSFLKNTSVFANLFKRRAGHDLDDDAADKDQVEEGDDDGAKPEKAKTKKPSNASISRHDAENEASSPLMARTAPTPHDTAISTTAPAMATSSPVRGAAISSPHQHPLRADTTETVAATAAPPHRGNSPGSGTDDHSDDSDDAAAAPRGHDQIKAVADVMRRASASNHSSNHTSAGTEKKVLSGVPSSNSGNTPDGEREKADVDCKEDDHLKSHSDTSGNITHSGRMRDGLGHRHSGDGDYSEGSYENSSQALRNLSCFDADRGEFVLTNHDIHSLEAYLFGTRALVAYINELQNALLEMQHASELAKKL